MAGPEDVSADFAELATKIDRREAVVGIIGLGCVGLPPALHFRRKKFRVIGFDVDQGKIDFLARGHSYIKHIPDRFVRELSARAWPVCGLLRQQGER
ncbi:MAG: NAD(P)-binding domain-containing protein [Desulfurivibrionaceae bacterium]